MDMNNNTDYNSIDLDDLELDYDTPSQPNTKGRLRPVQQRNRRNARRALIAKLNG